MNKTPTNGKKYDDTRFERLEISGATLTEATFTGCRFVGCDFSDATLSACRFVDCAFEDCTLRLTQVPGTAFSQTTFTRCSLMGMDWTTANWSVWSAKIGALTFADCDLKYGVFVGVVLPRVKLKGCNATEANFAEADLTDADLRWTDFTDAVFLRTNLTRANFVGATNYRLKVTDNTLTGAKFALPEAVNLLYGLDIVIEDAET